MKLRTVHKTIRKMMSGTDGPERSALRTACACIERNIPKSPVDCHGPMGRCPICNMWALKEDCYCSTCGQRLVW